MKGCLLTKNLLIIAVTAIIGSCAKQAAPTGGPKDITPPVVVKSVPPSGTTGFNSKKIVVTFNEYIVLDKLNEKFMISPPMNMKPNIYLKGKNLNIEFLEELRDSTTYTLYFQDAIRDLNEGNQINNFQYVFSTGKVIDSLSLTGNVLFADNLEPANNILVILHSEVADTAPVKLLPDYITLADINGGFRINNIKEGNYKLFALSDKNNNKRYDLADEPFAYNDTILNINLLNNWLPEKKDTAILKPEDKIKPGLKSDNKAKPDLKPGDKTKPDIPEIEGQHKLYLFTAPKKVHYLTSSSRKLPYQLVYTLSLPPDTMRFDFRLADSDKKNYFIESSNRKDTIMVWLLDSMLYSSPEINTLVKYPFTDSLGVNKYKPDTIGMRFIAPKPVRGKKKPSSLSFTTNISGMGLKPGQTIIISSQTPFRQPDTSKIRLYEAESKLQVPVKYNLIADTSNTRKYLMKASLKEGTKYLFIADSTAFGNIYGEVSDSAGISFIVREAKSFGHLELNIKNSTGKLIIQLLDNKEKLMAEKMITGDGVVKFPMLEKGFYRARVIYDLNGDGRWTTGDYESKLQPEPVSYYPGEIEMRVDFEITNEWDIGIRNKKDRSLRLKEKPGI